MLQALFSIALITTMAGRGLHACYDKIRDDIVRSNDPRKNTATGYQSISLPDLKVDIKGMTGKRISVYGAVQVMGEMVMLKDGPMDMNPIWINAGNLPRDDRKKTSQRLPNGPMQRYVLWSNSTTSNGANNFR
jgi:hypothetical protein